MSKCLVQNDYENTVLLTSCLVAQDLLDLTNSLLHAIGKD